MIYFQSGMDEKVLAEQQEKSCSSSHIGYTGF